MEFEEDDFTIREEKMYFKNIKNIKTDVQKKKIQIDIKLQKRPAMIVFLKRSITFVLSLKQK